MARDCPKAKKEKPAEKGKAKARAYAMTIEEAKKKPKVVSGTFLLNSIPTSVLFDSGATFSLIASTTCTL
jgi:hypothetical protein